MLKLRPSKNLHVADYGWHKCRHHFTFAEYDDPDNRGFGILQALNDDELSPSTGFDSHPHEEMEIISYCLEGCLTHSDGMGNHQTINPGDVQYLCAGSGVLHAEGNASPDKGMRFLQIWVKPSKSDLAPDYSWRRMDPSVRRNRLHPIVSGNGHEEALPIQQDATIYVSEIDEGKSILVPQSEGRQSFLVCLLGRLAVEGIQLRRDDALEIIGQHHLEITALERAHLVLIEMAAEA